MLIPTQLKRPRQLLVAMLRRLKVIKLPHSPNTYGWDGNYESWADALRDCKGYNQDLIFEKTIYATRQVRHGYAAFERDSVLFDKPSYNWPLIACLMNVAAANGGRLRLVDFGGALGSTYNQNRTWLGGLKEVRWHVVEQPHYVAAGRGEFQDQQLKFFSDIDAASECQPNAILMSGVLAYLESPYRIIQKVLSIGCDNIIFDRTGFTLDDRDRLTVQRVPPAIYEGSYPCWFLSKPKLLNMLTPKYKLMAEFDGADTANIPSEFKGFLFRQVRNE